MLLCPLFSGSSGNSTLVELCGLRLLVDAGKPARAIEAALRSVRVAPESVNALLITHEHTDHISGAGILSRRYDIPIYANEGTWAGMERSVGTIAPRNRRVFETGMDFYLGGVDVLPFKTPHDANESVGYSFSCGGSRIGVMTDVGHVSAQLLENVAGSDLLLIEANHDPDMVSVCRYPYVTKRRILGDNGHLSNENCGRALARLYLSGVRRAVLGHLSQDNNLPALALASVREVLRRELIPDEEFSLWVAKRDAVTGVFELPEAAAQAERALP